MLKTSPGKRAVTTARRLSWAGAALLCLARPAFAQEQDLAAAGHRTQNRTATAPPALVSSTSPVGATADGTKTDATAPQWETLKAAYDYSSQAAGTVQAETQQDADYVRVHLSFLNHEGKRVTGLFLRPKAEGVYPCVLLLHGLGGSKETIVERLGKTLLARGVATLSLDANLHGERKPAADAAKPAGLDFLHVIHGSVVEYRQAVDYLQTRKDVDGTRLGLAGYSMGAMMGAIISGVEPRLQYTVLYVGGDLVRPRIATLPAEQRPFLQSVSPANYVGHISPRPVLIINGEQDTTVPKSAALPVQEAAHPPREIRWINGGHELPKDDIRKAMEELADHLHHPHADKTTAKQE